MDALQAIATKYQALAARLDEAARRVEEAASPAEARATLEGLEPTLEMLQTWTSKKAARQYAARPTSRAAAALGAAPGPAGNRE